MQQEEQIAQYLDAATAGLEPDRELQMDVRAELRSHIDARIEASDGVEQALQAMGPAAELGGELLAANRARMRMRAVVRHAVQWLLLPTSIAIALLMTDWSTPRMLRWIGALAGDIGHSTSTAHPAKRLTSAQHLVVFGDTSRSNVIQRERAIWERWPQDKIYAHNYLTTVASHESQSTSTSAAPSAALAQAIAEVRPLDPDNARYDYLLAAQWLSQGAKIDSIYTNDAAGERQLLLTWTIQDRPALDEAMRHLREGLTKPVYRRYSREMLARRQEALGQPKTLYEEVQSIDIAAGVLLPDVAKMRALTRGAIKYGELLASEGRPEEARVFLDAWKRLHIQMNGDAFTLIDVLVAAAIADAGRLLVPPIYEAVGDSARADRAHQEATALAEPVRAWKDRRKAAESAEREQAMKDGGGVLAGLLLPALGEYPTDAELAPSRYVEYAIATGLVISLLSVGLLLGMLICGGRILFQRVRGKASLLLLPTWGATVRILLAGVLLPLGMWVALTHCPSLSGWDLGLHVNYPKFAMQSAVLIALLLWLPVQLATQWMRGRCRALLIPVPPSERIGAIPIAMGIALTLAVSLLPGSRLYAGVHPPLLFLVLGVLWGVILLIRAVLYILRFGERSAYRLFRASTLRSLIPVYALALILVSLTARPYLRFEERRWVARDTLMAVPPGGGFTTLEMRLTEQLKAAMTRAAAGLQP